MLAGPVPVPVLRGADAPGVWTDSLPYDKITSRKIAAEIAELLNRPT
jgi:hypothetical protein